MIIDSIHNAAHYYSIHPAFEKAFRYIRETDLAQAEVGKTEIDEELRAQVSDKIGMKKDESLAKFECHNKNIDIQFCISGVETFGWKPRNNCTAPKGEYNEEKDVQFYNDSPDMFFQLRGGQFVIFFPEDVHAPMISDEQIKKLVIKVKK